MLIWPVDVWYVSIRNHSSATKFILHLQCRPNRMPWDTCTTFSKRHCMNHMQANSIHGRKYEAGNTLLMVDCLVWFIYMFFFSILSQPRGTKRHNFCFSLDFLFKATCPLRVTNGAPQCPPPCSHIPFDLDLVAIERREGEKKTTWVVGWHINFNRRQCSVHKFREKKKHLWRG